MEQYILNVTSQLLFFIVPLLIYYVFWLNTERRYHQSREFAIFTLCAVSILLCMTVPLELAPGYLYDLRLVPLAIGVFYGGPRIGYFLLLVILGYRFHMGGEGIYATVFVHTALYTVLAFLSRAFIEKSLIVKLIRGGLGCLTFLLLSLLWFVCFSSVPLTLHRALFLLLFTVLTMISLSIQIYLTEQLRNNTTYKEDLKHHQKLKVISEIAASVSHEVRNPLTASRGFIQLLMTKENLPYEKSRRYLSIVLEELDRAQTIISDYLAFAKPQIPKVEAMDVAEHIRYVAEVLAPYAAMNQVEIRLSLAQGVELIGERISFRQCMINLLKNAIEASRPNDKVVVRLHQSGTLTIIEVEDQGVGMSKEQLRKLGTASISSKDKGNGIGTMVIYNIVRAMDGKIEVRSAENAGTCFTLKFAPQIAER